MKGEKMKKRDINRPTEFQSENVKERDHLEDLGVDGKLM
jgi:hypothetical protein